MREVVIGVSSWEEVTARAVAAFEGKYQGSFISFPTPERLWSTLTPKRWEIVQALTGAGPVSIREAARRVGRDVKAVHGDVTKLLNAGVLDRTEDGRIEFRYDAVHIDFWLKAA